MPTPYVTVGNIIAGPCTSFEVDGTPIGATTAGVTMERKVTFTDLEVDQIIGPIRMVPSKDVMTVTTTMAEATLQNLQIAFNLAAAPVVTAAATGVTANTQLDLGLIQSAIEHTLVFKGPCPTTNGYSARTVTLNRCVNMGASKMAFEKGKETAYLVEFTCMPSLTATAGSEFGTMVDE